METLDASLDASLYHRLRAEIVSGNLLPETKLPSERELAADYDISRNTVRQAIKLLLKAKLVYTHPGSGIFVSSPLLDHRLTLSSFSEKMEQLGLPHTTRVERALVLRANHQLVARLQLQPDAPVYLLERTRFIHGCPVGLEQSYLPQKYFPTLTQYDFATVSLYRTLEEELGILLSRAEERVGARLATQRECQLLELAAPLPLLTFERLTYDVYERVIEYSQRVYHPERYPLNVSLRRT
ncbi:MAG: GntR family transcriptional regulator [Chloroflexota bacterium]|nr:GntR family transcriptional regulator [Chloroflexota bacterium]